jgi:hypothetical protein
VQSEVIFGGFRFQMNDRLRLVLFPIRLEIEGFGIRRMLRIMNLQAYNFNTLIITLDVL